jgi:catechol 2,3-dioxygenase-like lactoylglutathione lyase family enzyme
MGLTGAQVNLYADDPDRLATFYAGLGMAEGYRFPPTGPAHIVELRVDGFTLGLLSRQAMTDIARLPSPRVAGAQAEIVLWCDDADTAHAAAIAAGAPSLSPCEDYNARLKGGWIADPEGNRVKFVSLLP